MTKDERLLQIEELLQEKGRLQVRELAARFEVTDMTIRRDLDELEQLGRLRRVHGGAVSAQAQGSSPERRISPETPYTMRREEHREDKRAIAAAAVSLIRPGEIVFLDSGSTTRSIAQAISPDDPCTWVTNAVNVASELLARGCNKVIVIGGEVDLNTWSSRGTMAMEQVRKMHFDLAFLACNAVTREGWVMIGNDSETHLKQSVMQNANRVYLAADSSKFDSYSLVSYAKAADFDGILTDNGLRTDCAEEIRSAGGSILQ